MITERYFWYLTDDDSCIFVPWWCCLVNWVLPLLLVFLRDEVLRQIYMPSSSATLSKLEWYVFIFSKALQLQFFLLVSSWEAPWCFYFKHGCFEAARSSYITPTDRTVRRTLNFIVILLDSCVQDWYQPQGTWFRKINFYNSYQLSDARPYYQSC